MAKTNSREREAVKSIYKSPKWTRRVNTMEDDQVVAIYKRFKKQGKVN